jgi:UTP:GlnB (protein PII) uridylyltransferase
MRESRRDEEAVAWTDGQFVECREHGRAILTIDPTRENLEIDVFAKTEPRRWALATRLEDQPGLRLAVSEVEVASGECVVRMEVDGQPLAGVEQLHKQGALAAVLRRVRWAEVRDRIRRDRVPEQPPIRERA